MLDIGKEFYHKLLNRNKLQGDGKYTADQFRDKYLAELESEDWWKDNTKFIELDFENVEVVGPSWANEVFAFYLTRNINKSDVLKKIKCTGLTKTKEIIINREIEMGYKGYV